MVPQKTKRHILFLIPYFVPAWHFGGPVKGTYEIAKRLAAMGHDITVCTSDLFEDSRPMATRSAQLDGMTVNYFSTRFYRLAYLNAFPLMPGLRPWLKRHLLSYDVVHIQECYSSMTLLAGLIPDTVPYFISTRGVLAHTPQSRRRVMKILFNALIRRPLKQAAAVIVQTPAEETDCRRFGITHTFELPNAVDGGLTQNCRAGAVMRKRFGFKDSDVVLLYLGRLHAIKGLTVMVRAIAAMRHGALKALIVGPDYGERKNLLALIAKLGLTERVILTDGLYGRDKLAAYSACDIFCLPSEFDNAPNTMLEAMAYGKPVITTTGNGLAGMLKNGAGLVVSPADTAALTAAMTRLADSETTRRHMGAKARTLVQKGFSWDDSACRLLELYESHIHQRQV